MIKPALSYAAVLCLCAACGGGKAETSDNANAAAPRSADAPAVAPAIVQPEEFADPAEPPSYEVAIASRAAEHNKAKERCETQPEAVRVQCEQEANAAFSDAREGLDRLRGNQP
jgi:hypothetical protein